MEAFRHMLQDGCDVVATVTNGHDAVDAVERLRPDVLVVDLMLPDLDGLEVCRRVKRAVPDTAVVMVTAFDDSHVGTVATQVGASAFLAKYSAATTLEHTIQRVIAERHAARERII